MNQELVERLAAGVRSVRVTGQLLRHQLDKAGIKSSDIGAMAEDDPRLPQFLGLLDAFEAAQLDTVEAAMDLCDAAGLTEKP